MNGVTVDKVALPPTLTALELVVIEGAVNAGFTITVSPAEQAVESEESVTL